METRVLDVAKEGDRAIAEAAEILRRGGLVAFPTETVYGLGALGLRADAVRRIFAAKERPFTDPLILHVGAPEQVEHLAHRIPPGARKLMAAFWPGPLTLVLPRSDRVPDEVTAGQETVAVRMPAHPVALELLRRVGEPVAAPSANLFGRPSPTTAQHVLQDLAGRIDAVLDAGPTPVGVESTIVDLSGERPAILRPGGIGREALEAVLGEPVVWPGEAEAPRAAPGQPAPAPGMLEKHYSPEAQVRLFDGEAPAVLEALRTAAEELAGRGPVVLLAYTEDLPALRGLPARVELLGSRNHPEEVARNLYAAFRKADEQGAAYILLRTAPPGGLGDAINDRLRRAAAGHVERV